LKLRLARRLRLNRMPASETEITGAVVLAATVGSVVAITAP
jgi:hypothetical protein